MLLDGGPCIGGGGPRFGGGGLEFICGGPGRDGEGTSIGIGGGPRFCIGGPGGWFCICGGC